MVGCVTVVVTVDTMVLDVAVGVAEVVANVVELRVVVVLSGAMPIDGTEMLFTVML
jgi:hypothetical protein